MVRGKKGVTRRIPGPFQGELERTISLSGMWHMEKIWVEWKKERKSGNENLYSCEGCNKDSRMNLLFGGGGGTAQPVLGEGGGRALHTAEVGGSCKGGSVTSVGLPR